MLWICDPFPSDSFLDSDKHKDPLSLETKELRTSVLGVNDTQVFESAVQLL